MVRAANLSKSQKVPTAARNDFTSVAANFLLTPDNSHLSLKGVQCTVA